MLYSVCAKWEGPGGQEKEAVIVRAVKLFRITFTPLGISVKDIWATRVHSTAHLAELTIGILTRLLI